MKKTNIQSPRNLFRLIELIGVTRSFSLPIYIGKNRHLKTVLRFLKNGKILKVEGNFFAVYGKQKVLMNYLKNDDFFILENLNNFESAGMIITVEDSGKIIFRNDTRTLRFGSYDVVRALAESFLDYKDLNVKDRFVIDVGAFLGDSMFYFWSQGAKKILAFEPFKNFYEIGHINILLNNLSNEIHLFNVGMGDRINEYDSNKDSASQNNLLPFVEMKTLIEKYNRENLPIVLKMDCEGCEYQVFRDEGGIKSLKSLGVVEFIMEYHAGDVSNLIKNLENENFSVFLKTKKSENIGILHGFLK